MQKSLVGILAILLTAVCFAAQEDGDAFGAARKRELAIAVSQERLQDVQRLLISGVEPNLKAQAGHSLLMVATWLNNYAMVDCLLKHGADPNHQNYYGDTALIIACCLQNQEIVGRLINAGANPDLLNNDCRNAFDCITGLTIEGNECIELDPNRAPDSNLRGYMRYVVEGNNRLSSRKAGKKSYDCAAIKRRKEQKPASPRERVEIIKDMLRAKMVLGPKRLVAAAPEEESWWSVLRVDYALVALLAFSFAVSRSNRD